jgi:hypothetical protein
MRLGLMKRCCKLSHIKCKFVNSFQHDPLQLLLQTTVFVRFCTTKHLYRTEVITVKQWLADADWQQQ